MLISNTLVTEIGIILDIQYKQVINFLIGQLKDIEFTGRLKRYEEVGQLFRKFEQTRNIRFERKGNSVVVSGKD